MVEALRDCWPSIDPSAYVHPRAVVIGDVVIGPRASIWPTAVIRGDMGRITIGEDSNIQDGAVLHNTPGRTPTVVGARTTVGHRAILHGCVVGSDVLIGMGAIVLDDVEIGPHCLIGAGALVPVGRRVPAGRRWLGMPARDVGAATAADLAQIASSWRSYRALAEGRS